MHVLEELDSLPLLWDPPHLWDPSQFVTPHYNNPNEAPHNNERLKRVRPHHSPQSSLQKLSYMYIAVVTSHIKEISRYCTDWAFASLEAYQGGVEGDHNPDTDDGSPEGQSGHWRRYHPH